MAGIYPDPTVAAGWNTIAQLRAWAGLSEEAYNAVIASTGDLGTETRFLAMLPAVIWRDSITAARIDPGTGPRTLTPTEAARAGVIWRVAQRMAWVVAGNEWATFADVDPCVAPTAAAPVAAPAAAGAAPAASPVRKIKLNNVIDQGDETEVYVQPAAKMAIWNQNYITATGGLPEEDVRCSVEQITALEYRITNGMTPYADFGVFCQYYRRANRAGKFRTWIPLGNGTYLTKELPGPENHDQWKASYRVFSVGLLSLQEATVLALQKYERCVEKLVNDYPEAWHLVVVAEDKMRAEHFEIIRTRITQDIADGLPAPREWAAAHPWIAVFRLAAEDKEFWEEQVRRPAGIWLQRGGKGCPLAPDERIARESMVGGVNALNSVLPPQGHVSPNADGQFKYSAERRAARAAERKLKKVKVKEAARSFHALEAARASNSAGGSGRPPAPMDISQTSCFSFSKNNGPCANAAPGSTCPQGRMHKCHLCGGAHQAGASGCRGGGKGGKNGKGGSNR